MNIKDNVNKVIYYLQRYGFWITLKKCLKRILHIKENRLTNQEQYAIWMQYNDPTEEELKVQRESILEIMPKISVVVPMYHTPEKFFKELVVSLQNQTYTNWELCLADGSEKENAIFRKYYEKDKRIKYQLLKENKGISDNTNAAILMATGEYIGFLDHDDVLSPEALFEIVKCIHQNKEVDFIYTDEDKIDEQGNRFEPYFKPDYAPETLACHNYITHFVVVKRTLIDIVGMLRSAFDGAQDFDFILRATEQAQKIVHIPKILYHWRMHRNSTAHHIDSKPYACEVGRQAVEEHLKRINKKGKVALGQDVPGIYKIDFEIEGTPKVSILIPNKDNIALLKTCVDSILKLTTYENYEVLIIENNSEKRETFDYYKTLSQNEKIKILYYPSYVGMSYDKQDDFNKEISQNTDKPEFNYSAIINFGVKQADGDFILQLNNDTKLLTPHWLEILIGYAQNPEIGAVGARLYYKDKTIQHAGIAYGLSGIAANLLVNLPYGKHAYFGREAATCNVSAVTGACLFTRKEIYEEVGFMDEKNFKIALNDVDFCLKILEKGYRIVYNPYVELIHYESKTRGYEYSKKQEARFQEECHKFQEIWKETLSVSDPYYNPNFRRDTCHFDIATKKV